MDLGLRRQGRARDRLVPGDRCGITRVLAAEGATVLVHGLEPGQTDATMSSIEAGERSFPRRGRRHPDRAGYGRARGRGARDRRPRRHRDQQLRPPGRQRLGVGRHGELARQLRRQRGERGPGHAGLPARHARRRMGPRRVRVDGRRDTTRRPHSRVLRGEGGAPVGRGGPGEAPRGHRDHRQLREPGDHRHAGGRRALHRTGPPRGARDRLGECRASHPRQLHVEPVGAESRPRRTSAGSSRSW